MALMLFDAAAGELRALPPVPGGVLSVASEAGARARLMAGVCASVLTFLGAEAACSPEAAGGVFIGERAPKTPGLLWLKLASTEAPIPDKLERGRAWLAVKTRYGQPLVWRDLARAEQEWAYLRGRETELSRQASAPNESALAAYSQRLRLALARDLDLPAAAACLLDALRPGALSPGSQRAFLSRFLTIICHSMG